MSKHNRQQAKKDAIVSNQDTQNQSEKPAAEGQEQQPAGLPNAPEGQGNESNTGDKPATDLGSNEGGDTQEEGPVGAEEEPPQSGTGDDVSDTKIDNPLPADTVVSNETAIAAGVVRVKDDFEIYTDGLRASGSMTLTGALMILEQYQAVMGVNTVTTEKTINAQQGALWRALRMVLNSEEDFEAGMNMLIQFFRQYADGAFQHHLLFRGFEHTTLNAENSKAFQKLLALITTAAESKNRQSVRKAVDLARAMESTAFTDEARSRVIGFFS